MIHNESTILVESINEEEKKVSARITEIRHMAGIRRKTLADNIGIGELELSYYEKAKKPVPASILALIGLSLGVNVTYFFDDVSI